MVQYETLRADPLRERACHGRGAVPAIARLRLHDRLRSVAARTLVLVHVRRQVRVRRLVDEQRHRHAHLSDFSGVET